MTSIFRPSAHALISGGASGIGLAVAELCLKHSMKVTIADFNQETLDIAKESLKGDVKCVKADVGDKADWKKLKQDVGEVDFLMLNAGIMAQGTWGDEDYFDKVFRTASTLLNDTKLLRFCTPTFSVSSTASIPLYQASSPGTLALSSSREVNRASPIHPETRPTMAAKPPSKRWPNI